MLMANPSGRILASVAAFSLLGACSPSSAAKKVLVIGIDGVRVDVLAEANTPTIDSLIATGVFTAAARNVLPTVSGPNWSSMAIGAVPDKHGVHSNDFSGNAYDAYPDFLTRVEMIDPSFETVAIVDWPPLGSDASGGPLFSDAIDLRVMVDGDQLGYPVADSFSAWEAARVLQEEDPDAMFVYLGNVDVVGHDMGSLSPEYLASIEVADSLVGAIVTALHARPSYGQEDWLILMSTDHGRRDDGGHGGESELERTVFFLASGDVAQEPIPVGEASVLDVAVTALAHLGIEIAAAWQLDGKSVALPQR